MANKLIQDVYKTIKYRTVIRSSIYHDTFMFILYSEFDIRNSHHFWFSLHANILYQRVLPFRPRQEE